MFKKKWCNKTKGWLLIWGFTAPWMTWCRNRSAYQTCQAQWCEQGRTRPIHHCEPGGWTCEHAPGDPLPAVPAGHWKIIPWGWSGFSCAVIVSVVTRTHTHTHTHKYILPHTALPASCWKITGCTLVDLLYVCQETQCFVFNAHVADCW